MATYNNIKKIKIGDNIFNIYDSGNNLVTQTATSTSANYELLFSATADNTTRTEGARKNSNLLFNPSTGMLTTNDITLNLTVTSKSGGRATAGADMNLYNALLDYSSASLNTSSNTAVLKSTMYQSLVRPVIWGGSAITTADSSVYLNKVDKDNPVISLTTSGGTAIDTSIYNSLSALGWTDCIV